MKRSTVLVLMGLILLIPALLFGWLAYLQTTPAFGSNSNQLELWFFVLFAATFAGLAARVFWIARLY